MRRITTFQSTTDRIYDGGPIRLYYNIINIIYIVLYYILYYNTIELQLPTAVMGKLFKEGVKGKEKNFRRANIIY